MYIFQYPRCGTISINRKTKHWSSNPTNTVIIVPHITQRGYEYKQKDMFWNWFLSHKIGEINWTNQKRLFLFWNAKYHHKRCLHFIYRAMPSTAWYERSISANWHVYIKSKCGHSILFRYSNLLDILYFKHLSHFTILSIGPF